MSQRVLRLTEPATRLPSIRRGGRLGLTITTTTAYDSPGDHLTMALVALTVAATVATSLTGWIATASVFVLGAIAGIALERFHVLRTADIQEATTQ